MLAVGTKACACIQLAVCTVAPICGGHLKPLSRWCLMCALLSAHVPGTSTTSHHPPITMYLKITAWRSTCAGFVQGSFQTWAGQA